MEELLLKLKELEINLKVVDENLKIIVPKSFDNPIIIEELRANKDDLISYLNKRKDLNLIESKIPKASKKESYPLTPAQFKIFLLNQLNKTSLAYNQTGVLKVTGELDVEKLKNVFESLIKRHECFRMRFSLDSDNKPIQTVLTNVPFEIYHVNNTKTNIKSAIHEFIRPFDLNNPPLMRVGLMEVSEDIRYILIDMHHIASDGVSLQILMREFTKLYEGKYLIPLQTQFSDYAEWFLSDSHQTSVLSQKKFWAQQFEEKHNVLELPYDFPRPKERTFKGSVAKFSVSNEEKHKLNEIVRKNDITFFTLLLGVYAIVLSKLSGKSNLVIGTLVAGRKHHELEDIIGMFANTLALPINIESNLSFKEYAQLLHQKVLSYLDNDDYPYEELINDLRLERDPGRNPLFDCVFVLQNIKQESFKIKTADIEEYPIESTTSKFDLTLGAKEDESGLNFELEYSTDLFKTTTIERFISYYKNVLKQIAQNPEMLLAELSLLSQTEKNTTLEINNLLDVSYPQSATIIDLFESQVEKHPNSVAVVYEGDKLTYAELNNLSNILAQDLRSQGIGRNDIVGLLVDKNLYTVVGMLGILKSGGCYLPLDPGYPEARIHYMLEDSKTAIVITDQEHEGLLGESAVKKILLEKVIDKDIEVANIVQMNRPEDLCYIIYTSGTTGNPKGVMVEHGNIVRLFFNDAFQFNFSEKDVWTMFHSHCFDFSVWEMYGALFYGGKVVIIPSFVAMDPSRYLQVLKNHKVTVLNQTPTAFNNLMDECSRKDIYLNDLRYVIFGGEALVPFKLKVWKEQYPDVKLVNMYGITEVTVHATYKEIELKDIEGNISNIGKPIPTTSLYVLDENRELVPQGVSGEIYVGGAGISRGYLNKGELTNSKFLDNPYREGERFYRSGDLGRILENGDLEYLGRIDSQVQLKGFRIELKEIEHNLRQHESIQDCVVIKRDSEEGHAYLCAYYTGEEVLEVAALRAHLGKHLPKYMIPSYFVKMDEFPVTSNNKIAISKLPSIDKESLGETYKAPTTEEESKMAEVWAEVLKVPKVGIQDNYFSLGGDSLKAIGLISNINIKLNASLTIADLYSFQTIEELAQKITVSPKDGLSNLIYEEAQEEVRLFGEAYRKEGKFLDSYEGVYPMNGVEKGMVFHSLKSKPTNVHEIVYHEQNIYDYPVSNFDFELFKHALDLMIDKHTTLRKVYDLENFTHIILKKAEPEVHFIDISNLDRKEQEAFIKNKLLEEKMRMTNLSFSLLWRINIIKVQDDYQYLLLDFHHSFFDGWSLTGFVTELSSTYSILLEDRNYIPKPLQSTYKDQIIGELAAAKDQNSISYWQEELDGYSRFELPVKHSEHKFRSEWFNFGKDFRDQLEQLALTYNTSFKHLCFAAYIYTMNMLSYKDDVTLGIVTNNRPLTSDGDKLLGCFLNTIPFRAKIPAGLTWGGYINYIEDKLRKLKYHERVPFHKILEITKEPANEHNPVFDISFNYIDFRLYAEIQKTDQIVRPNEFKASNFYMNNNTSIDFHIYADNSDFRLALTHSTAVFSKEEVQKLSGYFKSILDQFLTGTEDLLQKEIILQESDKEINNSINNLVDVSYPQSATIIDLFESQVDKHPNSVAVVYEGDKLTYAELNNLSNILAQDLRSQGIGRNDIVGLLVDKNLYTVVGMLGILKSGGCYLPLDPGYPEARIHYMLEDSKTAIVITDQEHEGLLGESAVKKILLEKVIDKDIQVANIVQMNRPEDLCYIIYTSGTTGNPKGVMVEHGNIVRLFFNDAFQFNFSEKDVWTMFHSHCFDFSVWEMYGALFYGGKVVIIPSFVAMDPSRYLQVLKNHKVTVLNQTPTAFNNLMDECSRKDIYLNDLRYVIFGGEALVPFKLKVWKEQYPDVKLVNMYGITEVTVHATYKEIELKDIEGNISNIGKPIPTTSLYVLDENRELVPQGVSGEIYVGGAGISRGYLNKGELTNSKFLDNPYREGERFYRSGDLGRILENGDLEYLGRIDSQVQLKGFRIELKEIEHNLRQHESIQDCVVIKRDSEEGHAYLCAYYTGEEVLEVAALRAHLGKHLPKYMIPSYFVKMDEFPVTSNNKIAISKLPSIDKESLGETYKAPTTEEESKMAEVWAEVLKVPKVGIQDNYFSLGGDSLKAIGLISNINIKLNASLTIADLYSFQTIEELAQKITVSPKDGLSNLIYEEAQEEVRLFGETYKKEGKFLDSYEVVYPMNGVEKGMVFEYLKSKSNDIHEIIYHEQNMYDYPVSNFDFELFKHALDLMIDKHTTLRKVYDLENFAHIILKKAEPEVNFIDISNLDRKEQEAFIKNKLLEEKRRITDLSFSLLWRINIIKVRDDYQYLLLDFHHSLFDGWSLSSFLTEFLNMYSILVKDRNYIPKPLQSTYKDQITGELAAAKDQNSISYWQDELDGYSRFELPSTEAEHVFISDVFELGNDFRDELEQLAVVYNTSFKHLCFAAYIYTMNMLTYKDDVTLGIVTNNRPLTPDGDRLLGCFLNTIPFRAKIPAGLTWGAYITYIEDKLRKLKYHERVPFHKILEITKEPSGQHNPVFDVAFNYLDFQIFKEWEAYDASIVLEEDSLSEFYLNEHFPFGFHIEAHDLRQEHGGVYNKSFRLLLRYSTAVFSKEDVKKLANYFKLILDQFLYSQTALMRKETILSKAENEDRELLKKFNSTAIEYEDNLTVLDLFSKQVQSNPEKIAVHFDGKKLTYGELDSISNQLSHVLIKKGVTIETLVPICVDRSFEMIIGILGILKAGGAYVPIDPAYPKNRIDYIIEDTKPVVVLTESKYQHLFSDTQHLNIDDKSIYGEASELSLNLNIPVTSLAYVIYTSGTTGNPKGVMNQHDGIYNRLLWMRDYLEVTEADNILQKTTFCFDVSVWELLLPLVSGARLVFSKPEGHKDSNYLQEIISEEKITIMHFVPSALSVFLLAFENFGITNLRAVICSGEELKLATVKEFRRKFNGVKLHNLYGPTEAAIDVTAIDLTANEEGIVTIGKPIANTQIYIVDNNNIQPIGVLGELLIGGVQTSRGYLNKPELTSEKFIVNPFDSVDKYKLYKTGDLARWLPNGTIEYKGRNDHQVKIRGHRIELGEIESALLNHPQIKNAVVDYRSRNDESFLIGYFVTDSDELDIQELKSYLRIHVPEYMIPFYFTKLDKLPITASGKIDRKSLPDPDNKLDRVIEMPHNEEEATMLGIWAETLGVEASKISVTDNFFDVGGHSLNAMKLNLLIRKTFSKDFNLKDVFNYATIRLMTEQVSDKENIKKDSVDLFKFDFNQLDNLEESTVYDATFEQTKEFIRFRIKGDLAFNVVTVLSINHMDNEIMINAISKLIDRHEILRTTLFFENGQVKQRIHPKVDINRIVESIVLLEGESIDEVQKREINKAFARKFNFEKEPSISIKILSFPGETQELIITMHHVIADKTTMKIMKTELNELYNNLKLNIHIELAPPKIQFKDYAILVNKLRKETELLTENFYEEKIKRNLLLNGTPYSEVIKDSNNSYKTTLKNDIQECLELQNRENENFTEAYGYVYDILEKEDGAQYLFVIDNEKLEKIEKIRNNFGTSYFLLIVSFFSIAIGKMKSKKSTGILLSITNRVVEEFEDVIGYLASDMLAVIDVESDVSIGKLVNNVSDTINETSNYRFYNYEKILSKLDLNLGVVAPVFLNYARIDDNSPAASKSEHLMRENNKSYFDINCTMQHYNDSILIYINYKLMYLDNNQMEELWEKFSLIVDLIEENPKMTVLELMEKL
jgi:amino acid adenylation domain-containing protein